MRKIRGSGSQFSVNPGDRENNIKPIEDSPFQDVLDDAFNTTGGEIPKMLYTNIEIKKAIKYLIGPIETAFKKFIT